MTTPPLLPAGPAPWIAFYGDDFTGSTDVLETLALAGLATRLFLHPPTPAGIAAANPPLQAAGIAGIARTLSPAEMDGTLPPLFHALRSLGAPIVHYKVCSTFDSSASTGSIGRAIEIGRAAFPGRFVPVAIGAPRLGRYVAFGNLFATSAGTVHRLDRHPVMSRHPVTPMAEADLRSHLARQSPLPSALLDLRALESPDPAAALDALLGRSPRPDIVVLDTVNDAHLRTAGALLDARAATGDCPFVVGSSGVEHALVLHWRNTGRLLPAPPPAPRAAPVDHLLVVSGSASPVTAAQVAAASAAGFATLAVDVPALLHPSTAADARESFLRDAVRLADRSPGLVAHTALGPDDPALASTRAFLGGTDATAGAAVGDLLGSLLRDLLARHPLPRVCICGGDSSGRACHALGVASLGFAAPLAPGAPICDSTLADGRTGPQLVLKGGQNGGPSFLEAARLGIPDPA